MNNDSWGCLIVGLVFGAIWGALKSAARWIVSLFKKEANNGNI